MESITTAEEWFQTNYFYFMGSICLKTDPQPFWECKISSHVMTSLQIACLSHHQVLVSVSVVFTTTVCHFPDRKARGWKGFVSQSISHSFRRNPWWSFIYPTLGQNIDFGQKYFWIFIHSWIFIHFWIFINQMFFVDK